MLESSVEDDRTDRNQLVAAVDSKVDLGALGILGHRLAGGLPEDLEGFTLPGGPQDEAGEAVVQLAGSNPVGFLAGAFQSREYGTGKAEGKNLPDVFVEHGPPPGVLQLQRCRPPVRRHVGGGSGQKMGGGAQEDTVLLVAGGLGA